MAPDIDRSTQQNIARTRVAVLLSFALNAGTNVLLIAYFARLGGLELVGTWVLLNAILTIVLILDFGVTDTLSFRVGRYGLAATRPLLVRAQWNGIWLSICCLAVGVGLSSFGRWDLLPFVISALAAVFQLTSNWRISIRTGQHQQYYFNLKTTIRVLGQVAFVIVLLALSPGEPVLALALALLMGGVLEFGFAQLTTRKANTNSVIAVASLHDLIHATSGFASTSTFQRALQPVSTLIVTGVLDQVAAAVFNVALRIPVVISQSISEALRGLLPGLAAVNSSSPAQVISLVRDAVISQIALIVPVIIFALFHTELLLQVWLGTVPEALPTNLRMLLVSTMITAVATPFHWANYALGQQEVASRIYVYGIAGILVLGALGLAVSGDVTVFVAIYALVQILMAVGIAWLAEVKGGYVSGSFSQIRWLRLAILIFAGVVLNLVLVLLLRSAEYVFLAQTIAVILGITYAGAVWHVVRTRLLVGF